MRNQAAAGVPAGCAEAIFEADPRKLPAYSGATNERGGFSIYKVER